LDGLRGGGGSMLLVVVVDLPLAAIEVVVGSEVVVGKLRWKGKKMDGEPILYVSMVIVYIYLSKI
jgi:hypothetical protein